MWIQKQTTGYSKTRPGPAEGGFDIESIKFEDWQRLVQISWAIHDARGECLHYDDYLIQPKGFEVTDVHYQVHGISTQLAKSEGVPVEQALKTFAKNLKKIDYVVGHFVAFDVGVITAECY